MSDQQIPTIEDIYELLASVHKTNNDIKEQTAVIKDQNIVIKADIDKIKEDQNLRCR